MLGCENKIHNMGSKTDYDSPFNFNQNQEQYIFEILHSY
jgi:hypothetical protein